METVAYRPNLIVAHAKDPAQASALGNLSMHLDTNPEAVAQLVEHRLSSQEVHMDGLTEDERRAAAAIDAAISTTNHGATLAPFFDDGSWYAISKTPAFVAAREAATAALGKAPEEVARVNTVLALTGLALFVKRIMKYRIGAEDSV